MFSLPETGFIRINKIINMPARGKRPATQGILDMGKTSWLNGVKEGKFPQPMKLGPRTVVWRVEDIKDLISRIGGGGK